MKELNGLSFLKFALGSLLASLVLIGCGDPPPAGKPISSTDPGGIGTPQERLKMLEANTQMDPQLKEKKRMIIMDEINGTHNAFNHPHQ